MMGENGNFCLLRTRWNLNGDKDILFARSGVGFDPRKEDRTT